MTGKGLAAFVMAAGVLAQGASAGPEAMTPQEARHLIARTGFGAAPHEITAFTGLSFQEGVARIMADLRTSAVTPLPAWSEDWTYPYDLIWALGDTQTDLFYANRYMELEELSAWWLAEMVSTPSPLTERLTLFWSDHFANSFEAHENAQWMAQQNAFLRTHAAGDFAQLAQGMLLDPAMLQYLSNTTNTVDAPNEDLGREFLELFTLGEGRGYDQNDVRAAARILTGYTLAEEGAPVPVFLAEDHDDGEKDLFGQRGAFKAEDLVALTLQNPEFGPYIVEQLWKTFISDVPDPVAVSELVEVWRGAEWQIAPLLEAMFLSDAFWDPANRGRLIKSPVELLVGTTRTFGLELSDGRVMWWMAEELGQSLFMSPNVGGWPEGVEWINDATASGRATTLTYLLQGAADTTPADMMMTAAAAPAQVDARPQDLRVGQVFASYVEPRSEEDGIGGAFTLYDVSFGGETWRSIPLWLEHQPDEDWAAVYAYTGDCAPECFAGLPRDEEDANWIALEPWDGIMAYWESDTGPDQALAAAIAAHLPAMLETTAGQRVYQQAEYGEETADLEQVLAAARQFSESGRSTFEATEGAFVSALSRPSVLGTSGYRAGQSEAEVDAMLEAQEEASRRVLQPEVIYASPRDWINALPGTGPESMRVAEAVLAVPRPQQGLRDEMVVQDAEALLRQLILSPRYQVK